MDASNGMLQFTCQVLTLYICESSHMLGSQWYVTAHMSSVYNCTRYVAAHTSGGHIAHLQRFTQAWIAMVRYCSQVKRSRLHMCGRSCKLRSFVRRCRDKLTQTYVLQRVVVTLLMDVEHTHRLVQSQHIHNKLWLDWRL